MAGEIGHVVYGQHVYASLGDAVDRSSFWVGTLFPDIGHIGALSRHRTHPDGVTIHSLAGENDFMTGLRAHVWIDATREKFLRDNSIKEKLPWHPFVPQALKLFEDEMLYDSFDDWDFVYRALNTIHKNERAFINEDTTIKRWHAILQEYIKHKPAAASRFTLARSIGLSEASAQELNSIVDRLQQDTTATELIKQFQRHLRDLLR